MRGRPHLYVSYESEQSLLPTWTQRVIVVLFLFLMVLIPLNGGIEIGERVFQPLGFLSDNSWLKILSRVAIFGIGALGLNILTGLAGQVSLGHAFFMGIGAYTAAVLGGEVGKAHWGLGLPIWIWLPAAGLVAALVGMLVAPTAVRVRGLYLAIVTLGLVFIGEYLFRNLVSITGGSQSGRKFPELEFRWWQSEEPALAFNSDGPIWAPFNWLDWLLGPWINFPADVSEEAKTYLILLVLLVVFVVLAKNLQRTRIGRAFMALRDRDIAAEVMGVPDAKTKFEAFAISSFYAGVAGALLVAFIGRTIPEQFNLLLSVQFVAIILIGGAGTVAGTLMGSVFVFVFPRLVQDFSVWLTETVEAGGVLSSVADFFVSTSLDDPGLVSTLEGVSPGLNVSQLNLVIYGLLIVGFLIFEPLGLYGIWLRIRNYWKGWPFTY
ncbi:MAG: branched-chain amino acid ABC transporter permease [Acidimicrobiia bacterium]|nr:branched-chain amino acid ABC transporter permease [Acidimicrobiia bacterium]